MRRFATTAVLGGLAVLLIVAAAIQVSARARDTASTPPKHGASLAGYLPAQLAGMDATDLPVAATAEAQRVVDALLNYSDAVVRNYQVNGAALQVFVAYWQPGRMSPLALAVHKPDLCWVGAGWRELAVPHRQLETLGGTKVLPGENRLFAAPGHPTMHVAYWLISGGEIFGYTSEADLFSGLVTRSRLMLRAVLRGRQHDDIYFIRLSSEQPIEAVLAQAECRPLRDALLRLDLARDPPRSTGHSF
jgi:hypothetical protein